MRGDAGIFDDTQPVLIEEQTRPPLPALAPMAFAERILAVANLTITASNPPTQAELQAVINKINELLGAMRRAAHLSP
ncbi:MAG TPA: hypothetical protein VFY40_25265 [Blastocatellia bacterium]|nr:hypothetical protein [Blastocatellia bacterium]